MIDERDIKPPIFHGACISAAEFAGREPTFTIRDAVRVLLEEEDRLRECTVVFFVETSAGWILNFTNRQCLSAIFGPSEEAWRGHKVTLTAAVVPFGEGYRVGVRVKGSPDLEDYVDAQIQLRGHDAYFMRLVRTAPPAAPMQPVPARARRSRRKAA